VACQKPELTERLVRRRGRDVCHDCHFSVQRESLQGPLGSVGSVRAEGHGAVRINADPGDKGLSDGQLEALMKSPMTQCFLPPYMELSSDQPHTGTL